MTHEEAIQKMSHILRGRNGAPLAAKHPMLVTQYDADGAPFAALCTHFAYGSTPKDALQRLVAQIEGGENAEEGELQSGRDEPAGAVEPQPR